MRMGKVIALSKQRRSAEIGWRSLVERYDRPTPRYTSYPTAPHFRGDVGPSTYASWLAALDTEATISFYVHVPFCDSLCWFCGCHTKVVQRYQPIERYVDCLLQEIDLIARHLGERRRVKQVHLGGGSPSILRPTDILRLRTRLDRRFDILPDAEIAVEIDPRGLEDEVVEALADCGVNRASIGIQDIDPEVQQAINRVQPISVTRSAVERLRRAGIEALNCDLMYGLPFQDEARLLASIDAVLAFNPNRLALFGYAHVPTFKRHQRMIPEAALPSGSARLIQFLAASHRLKAAGYSAIGLDHFARPDDPLAVAAENGRLHRNFQGYTVDSADALLGLGASAIGKLPQGFVQNAVPGHAYGEAVTSGRLACVRGLTLSDEDRLRSDVIEQIMCDFYVKPGNVAVAWGRPAAHFTTELESLRGLAKDGLLRLNDGAVTVTEAGRPFVRLIAAAFDAYLTPDGKQHSRSL